MIKDADGDDTDTDLIATNLTIRNSTGIGATLICPEPRGDESGHHQHNRQRVSHPRRRVGLGTINLGANNLNLRAITGDITDNTSAVTANNLTLTVSARPRCDRSFGR